MKKEHKDLTEYGKKMLRNMGFLIYNGHNTYNSICPDLIGIRRKKVVAIEAIGGISSTDIHSKIKSYLRSHHFHQIIILTTKNISLFGLENNLNIKVIQITKKRLKELLNNS